MHERGLRFLLVSVLLVDGDAHAVLTAPRPRLVLPDPGIKLEPFSDARNLANRGCGGKTNEDPGVQVPTVAYQPGKPVRIEWKLTIPHPADNLDTGIRVAIHYGPNDSFDKNILIGGLEGDPNFVDRTGDGVIDNAIPAAGNGAVANDLVATLVTLPAGKTCNYCTIQWIWAARADDGFYMQCADIAITTTGLLSQGYNDGTIPSEAGNELPQNNPDAGTTPGGNNSGDGGGGTVIAVVAGLAAVCAVLLAFYFFKRRSASPNSPPKPFTGVSVSRPAGGLPPGWTSAVDPASGRTYYSNPMTNETSWEPPAAVGGGGLPPGWSEARDNASGRVYYVNSATGASSWEKPRI
ncbi:hypothetical protein AB1Y20_004479 [Prymnesium parvum]|uniref:WW domain-containing protein n=1 Tax=Prymnesium parvum TaxID=97485 RepID=A0AB34IZC7_PRYPA